MAFAPAWSKTDNNAYLNDIVGEIIQTGGGGRDGGLCKDAGYNSEDDMVEVPWTEEFLQRPPEAASQWSVARHLRDGSGPISIKDLDRSINRSETPAAKSSRSSRSSWGPPQRSRRSDDLNPASGPSTTESYYVDPRSRSRRARLSSPRADETALPESEAFGERNFSRPLFPPHPAVRSCYSLAGETDLDAYSSISDAEISQGQFNSDRNILELDSKKAVAPSTEDQDYPTSWKLSLIMVGLCLAVFLISLDRNIITTAIPRITAEFGSYDYIGWYGSAYLMTACAFQPLYGRVYISFATKSSFLGALAVFEAGSLICALAPSSVTLIAGRAIQGLGSAGVLTGAFVVTTQSVPLHKRPVFFAAIGILYGCGATVGPLLGGVFTDRASWRWCFWFNLPVGAITFVSMMLFFKKPNTGVSQDRPAFIRRLLELDILSNMVLLGACIMLFVALEAPNQGYAWDSAHVIGLFAGTGGATVLLVALQWYMGDKALLPPRIILQRTVACSCLFAIFVYGVLGVHAYFLPIWFQAVKGTSAVQSGVDMIPYMLANALFGLFAGVFVSKNGYFTPPAIVGCAIGAAGCGLLSILHISTSSAHWIGYEVLVSAGLGMAVQQGFVAVQTVLPVGQLPIGTAAVVASQSLGGAIFISVGNTIFQSILLSDISNNPALSGLDTTKLASTGITSFRSMVDATQLQALLRIYNSSLRTVFIACIPLAGIAFLFSLGLEWKSVKAKQQAGDAEKSSTP